MFEIIEKNEMEKRYFVNLESLILIVLFACGIGSCSKETDGIDIVDYTGWGIDSVATEKGDNYEVTYQFKDNVIVLDKRRIQYLFKVEDDSILYFKDNMPDSIRPHIGSIYSARVTELTPFGLGNEVLSVSEDDGLIRCVTSIAPLDDIFEVLDLKVNLSMADIIGKEGDIYDENGEFHQAEVVNFDDLDWGGDSLKARTRFKFGSPEALVIPVTFAEKKNNNFKLSSDISLALGCIFTIEKNEDYGTFENSFEIFAGIKGRIGVEAEADGSRDIPTLLTHLFKMPIFNSVFCAGPVIFRPFIEADLSLKGKASGSASVGIAYKGSYKHGWNEKGKIEKNNFKAPHIENLISSFEINGKAQIGPEIAFHAAVGLYTKNVAVVLRPTIWISGGGELKFEIEKSAGEKAVANADAAATFDIEGGVEGAIEAKLFGKTHKVSTSTLQDITLNFLNISMPIFPKMEYSSFNIEARKNSSPLVFDAQYHLTGGFIAKLMGCKPALRVNRNGEEVYTLVSDNNLGFTTPTSYSFELENLEENTIYEAVPVAIQDKFIYEWKEKEFSSNTNNIVVYTGTCPDSNHPHALDLGLPSGTIWSCCNLGASAPQYYGSKYAWGETKPKNSFGWENYLYYDEATKTCMDIGGDICGTEYDVARIEWGNGWQIPSKEQFQELMEYMMSEGIIGFDLPMLKDGYVSSDYSGHYWTSTISSDNDLRAYHVSARYRGSVNWSRTRYELDIRDRYNGYAIRPVKRQ